MSDSVVKTRMFAHQADVFLGHRDDDAFGLLWEMGLGKTKVMIDVASHLFVAREIRQLVVIAPNSVYRNWVEEEIPRHMAVPHFAVNYPRVKRPRRRDIVAREVYLREDYRPNELRILAISYDAIGKTKHGYEFACEAVDRFPSMIVADESTCIGKPDSAQTRRCKTVREEALVRWIATGTPATEGPFKIWSQFDFIDETFWRTMGMRNFSAFKTQFGVFRTQRVGTRSFPKLEGYQQLDRLNRIISPLCSRLLKEDSGIELPPKSYVRRSFEMTPDQASHYDRLTSEYHTELDNGRIVDAPMALTRLIRLQQVASGHVTAQEMPAPGEEMPEDGVLPKFVEDLVPPDKNPRIALLDEILSEARGKVIVWCRFTREIDQLSAHLGREAVRYDGGATTTQRSRALESFKREDGGARILLANVDAIAYGVTLTVAKTMVYYSNNFSLEKRLQSEDRFHRIGQDRPVLIVDIVAERPTRSGESLPTVDHHVVNLLRAKFDIAAQVTGDRYREWIS